MRITEALQTLPKLSVAVLVVASAHAGKKPFETTQLSYGTQVPWPDPCVQCPAASAAESR